MHHTETDDDLINDFKSSLAEERILIVERSCIKCIGKNNICF